MRIGACLTSFAVLLAAGGCARGGDVAADSAVVTGSAGAHSATPDTVTPAPPVATAPAATSDSAMRDSVARAMAKTAPSATAPARGVADSARQAPRRVAVAPPTTSAPVGRDAAPTASAPAQGPAQAPAQNPAAQQTAGQGGDKLAVSQGEYNGWKTFAVNCVRCHGEDAIGSALAPSLLKSLQGTVDHTVFVQTVKKGRAEKGMPAWESLLSDQQVEDLWAYLKARSDGRLAAGRPRVASGN